MTLREYEDLGLFLLSLDDHGLVENIYTTTDIQDFITEALEYMKYL